MALLTYLKVSYYLRIIRSTHFLLLHVTITPSQLLLLLLRERQTRDPPPHPLMKIMLMFAVAVPVAAAAAAPALADDRGTHYRGAKPVSENGNILLESDVAIPADIVKNQVSRMKITPINE